MKDVKSVAFKAPPIWEVGISVGFPFPGWFKPYDVREVHDLFRTRFPAAERQTMFAGLRPLPSQNAPVPTATIEFGTAPDLNRWWFVSESGCDLIQVQENFLARNWRRLTPPPAEIAPYPGFEAVYDDFRATIGVLQEWSTDRKRTFPKPDMCELLYEDLIPLIGSDGKRRRLSEIVTPLRFDPPISGGGLTLTWLECMDAERRDGPFTLQMTIQMVGMPDPAGAEPISFVKLSFVARTPCDGWDEAFGFIEAAHTKLGQRLVDLTTGEVRATWGPA